ncbi:ATP-binding protein [Polymorphum gilvum]|uniref:histidine kinase n=1 Tax=Polymorphum gilvum (strain LMG 25793 / CGMCC 1.9160 / SL003B-26A1) TaxID=991905 RepID=F2J2X6_POLGS|nr:ATP-binding protein [Polymorphum gilvum]ADZ68846.1 ATPase, histidine kinase-, DNA gyrase B-, and HSP90-like domain protein [Polymorphum gilvum SL003B-26A1]
MTARQRILPVRRQYNQWVNNQTLEDYALRFTAKSARRFSSARISQTAIGAISFLALEAIGGAITLSYGTANAFVAILAGSLVLLVVGLPIARTAMRHGVDIDLLTRGAGFGYIGSTVTSLIYASFTFILFAIEASIMSSALEYAFGLPLWIGYIVSALAVIPLVTHGIALISRFQLVTQPFWIVLNIAPFAFIAAADWQAFGAWLDFAGIDPATGTLRPEGSNPIDLLQFGAAAAVILALMAQIGEQVDFLRFLPEQEPLRRRHRLALFLAGPGWVVLGAPKMLAGSFLAVLVLSAGIPVEHADEPSRMFAVAFGYMLPSEQAALLLMAAFVVVSQLKINVMNAYAGSLAWSNFFSRLTHSHPGRVVWLVFNVGIALLLMELGIYRLLEETLGVFSIVAMAWLSAISADLFVNKPLGLSPPGIEFKRAHLHDVNPVGTGAMVLAATVALVAHYGWFGREAAALATFLAMAIAFLAAPAIAALTRGRYYLARKPRRHWQSKLAITCSICENPFEPEDMAYCPAYQAPICSLCCSLDARCHDLCKPKARVAHQVGSLAERVLPAPVLARLRTRLGRYLVTSTLAIAAIGLALLVIYHQAAVYRPDDSGVVGQTVALIFFVFAILAGIAAWFLVLAHDTRHVAEEESARQTALLLKEIEAHRRTDAALQKAKEAAEAANLAKSRYVVGLSHELRTPLNAVLGYAQVLERDEAIPRERKASINVIRRSAEHLSGLIDGLLDISRIEAGRLQVYSNEINIHDFLDQIVAMFRLQAQAKGLGFSFARADNLPAVVRTDEKRLRQILVNLLSNALKFTDTGAIGLEVGYRSQVATFRVTDTGRGIAPVDLPRIFEAFGRGEEDRLKKTPGLGLGLTITKLLAETLGGAIRVDSAPGCGSTFEVRLMLAAVADPKPAAALERRPTGYAGPRRTVLVVDDNLDHRELMTEILAPLGFVVLTAEDGPRCLALVAEVVPDLFLVDISMPGMTGWELVARLRAVGHAAPVIMLSANIGDGASRPTGEALHNDTLAKPFDLRQLLDKLEKHLGLEWTFTNAADGKVDAAPAPAVAAGGAPIRFKSPGAAHVRDLISLGEIGYVHGIEAKLSQLAEEPDNAAVVAALRGHIEKFDFAGYRAVLKGLGEDDQRGS